MRLTIPQIAIFGFLILTPLYLSLPHKRPSIPAARVHKLANEYQADRRYWEKVAHDSQIAWSVTRYPTTLGQFVWRSTLYSWR